MKNYVISGISILCANVAWSTLATAQAPFFTSPRANVVYGASAAYGAYNPYGGYGGYGGQTAVGASATGIGNLVRAQGDYNEQTAKSMISYEKARSLYIDNQNKLHHEYLERKRVTQAQNSRSREAAIAARDRELEFMAAHRPTPLSSSQIDDSTGHIQWPSALRSADFDDLRTAMESSFEARSMYGLTSDLSSQIVKTTGEMKDLLRGRILTIPMPDYSASRKFLDSMAATVQ